MRCRSLILIFAVSSVFDIVLGNERIGYGRAVAGTRTDNAFSLPVDVKTCTHDGHQLQIKRALKDLEEIVELGLETLYNSTTFNNCLQIFWSF